MKIPCVLHNSYFQIPVKKQLWGYMAITTPYRGIRLLTRTGQGLLNSNVHLDQLTCKVLGDEIAEGITEVAGDDIQVEQIQSMTYLLIGKGC